MGGGLATCLLCFPRATRAGPSLTAQCDRVSAPAPATIDRPPSTFKGNTHINLSRSKPILFQKLGLFPAGGPTARNAHRGGVEGGGGEGRAAEERKPRGFVYGSGTRQTRLRSSPSRPRALSGTQGLGAQAAGLPVPDAARPRPSHLGPAPSRPGPALTMHSRTLSWNSCSRTDSTS